MSRVLSTRSSRTRLLKRIATFFAVAFALWALYGAYSWLTVPISLTNNWQMSAEITALLAVCVLIAFACEFVCVNVVNWVNNGLVDEAKAPDDEITTAAQ